MKYIEQFLIIISISFVGEVLHELIPLPVPASIYGLVIMFLCLVLGVFPLSAVKETADFLVSIISLMFIPAGVGLITAWEQIKSNIIPYSVITFVVTFIVMIVSGHITQLIIQHRKGDTKND